MADSVLSLLPLAPDAISKLGLERGQRVQGYLHRDSTLTGERIYLVANKGTYPPDSTGVRVGLTLRD